MAERQALFDTVLVGGMDAGRAAEAASALGDLCLAQVASARARAQDFSAGGNLKALGCGLLGFDAFGTSHNDKLSFKKSAEYKSLPGSTQAVFSAFSLLPCPVASQATDLPAFGTTWMARSS